MTLPGPVQGVCETFLAAAPTGLVTGLYLRGGVGFGEWIDGQSDVDFVATVVRRPTADEADGLRAAHDAVAAAYPAVQFDGPHLLPEDLATDPRHCPDVPRVLGRIFEAEQAVPDAMVAWHELAWHGVAVHGPPLDSLGIWTSLEALREFTRDNLDSYWRVNAETLATMPQEATREDACCWCVLGVARLHHLLVTKTMTTKSRAGRWGLGFYPDRHHRVLREALRIREGGADEYIADSATRGRDTADFLAYVIRAGTAWPAGGAAGGGSATVSSARIVAEPPPGRHPPPPGNGAVPEPRSAESNRWHSHRPGAGDTASVRTCARSARSTCSPPSRCSATRSASCMMPTG